MSNSIAPVTKYLDTYQDVLLLTGLTGDMNKNKQIVFTGTKTVKVLKADTGYATEYNRAVGYVKNDVNGEWQEETMSEDRQHCFGIDTMDSDECGAIYEASFNDAQKKDLAEIDFYRLGKIASTSGITVANAAALSNGQAIDNAIADAEASIVDNEGDLQDCVLYITPVLYTKLKRYLGLNCGRFTTLKDVDFEIEYLDKMKVVQVPQARFYVGTQYNASTKKIEAKQTSDGNGGYTTQKLNFMIVNMNGVAAPVKIHKAKLVASDVNQTSDEDQVDIRFYHTCFVLDNFQKTIYSHPAVAEALA